MREIATNKKVGKPVTIAEIRRMQGEGYTISQIAQKKGISRQAIYQKINAAEKKAEEDAKVKMINASQKKVLATIGDEKAGIFVQYHVDLFKMGQGCDKHDVEGLYQRFYRYLEYCAMHNIVPNNMSAYLGIGIRKEEVYQWSSGIRGTPEHQKFAQDIQAFFASIHEQGGTDGVMNPIQTIFWQKAYDGLSDQPKEVEITVNPLGEKRSAEQIAKDYSDLPD